MNGAAWAACRCTVRAVPSSSPDAWPPSLCEQALPAAGAVGLSQGGRRPDRLHQRLHGPARGAVRRGRVRRGRGRRHPGEPQRQQGGKQSGTGGQVDGMCTRHAPCSRTMPAFPLAFSAAHLRPAHPAGAAVRARAQPVSEVRVEEWVTVAAERAAGSQSCWDPSRQVQAARPAARSASAPSHPTHSSAPPQRGAARPGLQVHQAARPGAGGAAAGLAHEQRPVRRPARARACAHTTIPQRCCLNHKACPYYQYYQYSAARARQFSLVSKNTRPFNHPRTTLDLERPFLLRNHPQSSPFAPVSTMCNSAAQTPASQAR